jgi:hypothetical protein
VFATARHEDNIVSDPIKQIDMIHDGTDGWIALCKKTNKKFNQHHYKLSDALLVAPEWVEFDSYVSMNTFYTPKRLESNLRELRTFYVDLDCYNVGLTPDQVVMNLKADYFNTIIPTPNLINYSGRGVNLIWFLQPLSGLALERWDKLQNKLQKTLKPFGSDEASTDASRIFRLAGSVNSKCGEIVHSEVVHRYRYSFDEVVEEFFPSVKEKKPKVAPKKVSKQNSSVTHIFNEYSLIKTRMEDIKSLVTLRSGLMVSCRETALFLYRYWSLVEGNDTKRALDATIELNATFRDPLPVNEVTWDTKSAEMYFDSEEGFQISNEKIIKWLKITSDEQKHLKTIISRTEKRRRNTEHQRLKRGSVSKEDYIQERQNKRNESLAKLKQAIQENPKASIRKLAEITGLSKSYVQQIKKTL